MATLGILHHKNAIRHRFLHTTICVIGVTTVHYKLLIKNFYITRRHIFNGKKRTESIRKDIECRFMLCTNRDNIAFHYEPEKKSKIIASFLSWMTAFIHSSTAYNDFGFEKTVAPISDFNNIVP